MTFTSIEKLKEYLIEDQNRATISPIRFINVETMVVWSEVKKVVLSLCDKSLFLSDFCEGEDTTPNIRRALSRLKTYDKTVCVVPLSEYLRIKPESALSTINKILSTEYDNNENGKLRIYFLMYRMKDILRNVPNDDPRRQNTIIYLNTSEESDYSLTIIQDDIKVSIHGNEIYGFKKYLQYWEQNPDKPLILHTKNAIYFEENNFFDNVMVIANSFDLLRYRYELPIKFEYSLGSVDDWNSFAKSVTQEGDFESACKAVFHTNKYEIDLFGQWNKFDEYKKWLIWLWTKNQSGTSYIFTCANETKTVEQFQNELFTSIVRYISSSSYATIYAERRNVLRLMQLSALPTEFLSKLNALPEIDALKCLTDLTLVERKAIFGLLKVLGYNRRRECYEILKNVYPDLYYYFVGNKTDNPANMTDRHKSYFEKYKWQKITNTLTEDFDDLVKQYAYEKGESIYSIQPRSLIVSELYDDDTAVLFVDGMGAEYVDYLSNLFADLQETEYAVSYNVGYCHLPTVTEINKDFLNSKKTLGPIYALDELKHSTFSYPLNITKEFDELKKIKELVLNAFNETTKRVIIASDHGTSRLAVLVRETKFDNKIKAEGLEIYRYGRYCIGTDLEQELPTAINYDGKLIFADYTRFEQKGAPSDEIHGGASIEEWLVPIVCVEKRSAKRKKEEKCEIETTTPIVEPEIGTGQVAIAFVVRGRKCKKVNATIKGIRYACTEKDSEYFFNYIPAKNETEVKVLVSDNIILGEFVFKIKQKISQNKKFDI